MALAQSQQSPAVPDDIGDASGTAGLSGGQLLLPNSDQQVRGRIGGRIVDQSGVGVAGARLRLTLEKEAAAQEVLSGDDGQFAFANVVPGFFRLTITSAGFAAREFSGNLRSGQSYAVPQIILAIAPVVTEVRVVPSQVEEAQEEIKAEEKQRALGLIPNFYVSYVHDAAPLTARQKFDLAWKTTIDPVNFGLTGVIAGVEQSQNSFD